MTISRLSLSLFIAALMAVSLFATTLDDLIGPTIPLSSVPWGYYKVVHPAVGTALGTAALASPPSTLGSMSCNVTLDLNGAGRYRLTAPTSGCAQELSPVTATAVSATNPAVMTVSGTPPPWIQPGVFMILLKNAGGASDCFNVGYSWIMVTAVSGSDITLNYNCTGKTTYTAGTTIGKPMAVVKWNAADGAGTGKLYFSVDDVVGNQVNGDGATYASFMLPIISAGGLTNLGVDFCYRCNGDTAKYSIGMWGFASAGNNGWNAYGGVCSGLYRLWKTTGDSTYYTMAGQAATIYWQWHFNQGAATSVAGLQDDPLCYFMGAADGHPSRYDALYTAIKFNFDNPLYVLPNALSDTRQQGFYLQYAAIGAFADPDAARHAWYCSAVTTLTGFWIDMYNAEGALGFWPEGNENFPYQIHGFSPWRQGNLLQGLWRSYDVLKDTTSAGCNQATLAATLLPILKTVSRNVYDYGYNTSTRITYYASQYEANGAKASGNGGGNPGTLTVTAGSKTVTGVGTSFTSRWHAGDFLGVYEPALNKVFVQKIATVSSDTSMTLQDNWGTECGHYYNSFGAPANTATMFNGCAGTLTGTANYYYIEPSTAGPSNCHNLASYCNDSGNLDDWLTKELIYPLSRLYAETRAAADLTALDNVLAVMAGGPGDGPGGVAAPSGPAAYATPTGIETALPGCTFTGGVTPCTTLGNYTGIVDSFDNAVSTGCSPPTAGCISFNVYGGGRNYGQSVGVTGADNAMYYRTLLPAPTPPTITTSCPLPDGTKNSAYSQTLTADGDTPSWSYTGTLPTGLSLNDVSGEISGTPSAAGTFSFAITATNATGSDGPLSCSITINNPTPHPAATRFTGRVILSGTIQ